jgi:hypothetical protein
MQQHTRQLRDGMSMTISFPNQSRSFDATRRAVRFWGYESAMETSFFIEEEALRRLEPGVRTDEGSLLKAFDSNRERIFEAAAKVYARRHKGSYDLTANDV